MLEQLELFAVPNPCRGICEADARGFCRGCFRSRSERFAWGEMTDVQKQDVIRLCIQRKKRLLRVEKTVSDAEWAQPSLFDDQ